MAWTAPKTIAVGDLGTASDWNTYVRDNSLATSNATSWTPVITQSGTVTKTVTYATYVQVGGWTKGWVDLAVTGAGTGANLITVSTPSTAAASNNIPVGSGFVQDASVNTYPVAVLLNSTTLFAFTRSDVVVAGGVGNSDPNFALANTDRIYFFFMYPSV